MIRYLGIAESDCERIRDGFFAQPANTISSLAYVAIGLWVCWRVARGEVVRRDVGLAFGIAVIVVGIGSVAFHGPGSAGGRFLHDFSIAALLLVIIGADLVSLHRSWVPAAAGAVLAAAVLVIAPDTSNAVAAVLVAAAIVLEVFVAKITPPATSRGRRAIVVAVAALVIAGTAQLLGRTDAPLCEPENIWQAHALWHVLTAVALGALSIPLLDRHSFARSGPLQGP